MIFDDDHKPLSLRLIGWCEAFAANLLSGALLLLGIGMAFALAGAIGGLGGMALFELRAADRGGPLEMLALGVWAIAALSMVGALLRALWSKQG